VARLSVFAAGRNFELDSKKLENQVGAAIDTASGHVRSALHAVGDFVATVPVGGANQSPFDIDENTDFTINPEDSNQIAFLKQNINHWRSEARQWRTAYESRSKEDWTIPF